MSRLLIPLCIASLSSFFSPFPAFSDNIQIRNESGNSVVNQGSGSVSIYAPHTAVVPSPATKDVADSLNKIVRFLEASNPTKIQLGNVRLLRWSGESDDVLTLDLENSSNMPGYKVKVTLIAPRSPGGTKSNTLSMKPALGFTKETLETLSVEAHGTQSIPMAAVSELRRFLRFPEGYDLIGVGLSPNMPSTLLNEYANRHRRNDGGSSAIGTTSSFIVQISYETAFGGKNTASMAAFLYFAKPGTPPQMLISPSAPG